MLTTRVGTLRDMSKEVVVIILLAVAGFLVGGVYSTYKTAKILAMVLGLAAAVAIGGAVVWMVS
jgi:hypothetical protein